MTDGGSIMSLTFGASRQVVPNYNAMAIAKAALEAITLYLAADLGQSQIRVNAISAGAIKTLSAGGIAGFRDLLKYAEATSPMKALVSQDDVGDLALFLASDLSKRITGEVIYADAGHSIMGYTDVEALIAAGRRRLMLTRRFLLSLAAVLFLSACGLPFGLSYFFSVRHDAPQPIRFWVGAFDDHTGEGALVGCDSWLLPVDTSRVRSGNATP